MEDIRDTATKTLVEHQVATLNAIQGGVLDLEEVMYQKYMGLWTLVWKNPDLEPRLVVEGLGGRALSLFQLAGAISGFLSDHVKDKEILGIPPYYEVKFNVDANGIPDGTGTVTTKSPPPSKVTPAPESETSSTTTVPETTTTTITPQTTTPETTAPQTTTAAPETATTTPETTTSAPESTTAIAPTNTTTSPEMAV